MSTLFDGKRLRYLGLLLIALSLAAVGCRKTMSSRKTRNSDSALTRRASTSGRDQRVLDYLLNNRQLKWSTVEPEVAIRKSPTGELKATASRQDVGLFQDTVKGRTVPDAMRALLQRHLPMGALASTSRSTLTFAAAQEAIGKWDSSYRGGIPVNGSSGALSGRMAFGTWYRYGAVEVAVDDAGLITGIRVDLAGFKR